MTASEGKSQVETDLDRARERLSFYEQFDEIIKQNIASSSALLKEASARFDSDVADERDRYRDQPFRPWTGLDGHSRATPPG